MPASRNDAIEAPFIVDYNFHIMYYRDYRVL